MRDPREPMSLPALQAASAAVAHDLRFIAWMSVALLVLLVGITIGTVLYGSREARDLISCLAVLLAGGIGVAVIAAAINPARNPEGF